MIDIGAEHGSSAVKQLHQEILARYGLEGEFPDEQDARKRFVELSSGRDDGGIYRYELTLDAEGRAVLEAALGPLPRPQPEPDGTVDPRPVGRRRGGALVEVCRRAVAAGDRPATSCKAAVFVTMTWDELRTAAGAGPVVGSLDGGSLLGPETVRRMACDAAVIPVVLGSDSEILDAGRAQRLFNPAQLKTLWLRDQQCTFPGCQVPAYWTDAHHLWHWIDSGPTELANGALLCGRHHTIVHHAQLAGTLIDGQVLWDRRPGSYQRHRDESVITSALDCPCPPHDAPTPNAALFPILAAHPWAPAT